MVAKIPQYNTVYFPIFSAISMSSNAYSHFLNVLEPRKHISIDRVEAKLNSYFILFLFIYL